MDEEFILHPPAYEDGTDKDFRNVGSQNSDPGELPKKEHITIETRRKLENNEYLCILLNSKYGLFFWDLTTYYDYDYYIMTLNVT